MLALFLSSGLGKDTLGLIAVCLLVFGVYEFGHSRGSDEGYKNGVAAEKIITDKLAKQIDEEHTAQAAKVQTIQHDTSNAVVDSQTQQAAAQVTRTQIVDHYHTVTVRVPVSTNTPSSGTPSVEPSCGIGVTAVTTINALLDTQVNYDNEAEYTIPDPPTPTPQPSPIKSASEEPPVLATNDEVRNEIY